MQKLSERHPLREHTIFFWGTCNHTVIDLLIELKKIDCQLILALAHTESDRFNLQQLNQSNGPREIILSNANDMLTKPGAIRNLFNVYGPIHDLILAPVQLQSNDSIENMSITALYDLFQQLEETLLLSQIYVGQKPEQVFGLLLQLLPEASGEAEAQNQLSVFWLRALQQRLAAEKNKDDFCISSISLPKQLPKPGVLLETLKIIHSSPDKYHGKHLESQRQSETPSIQIKQFQMALHAAKEKQSPEEKNEEPAQQSQLKRKTKEQKRLKLLALKLGRLSRQLEIMLEEHLADIEKLRFFQRPRALRNFRKIAGVKIEDWIIYFHRIADQWDIIGHSQTHKQALLQSQDLLRLTESSYSFIRNLRRYLQRSPKEVKRKSPSLYQNALKKRTEIEQKLDELMKTESQIKKVTHSKNQKT